MSEWKTMLEVAHNLGVSKRVIKYHKEKLSSADKRVENGIIVISPRGVEQLRRFIRPKDHSSRFETEVIQRLESLETILVTNCFGGNTPKKVLQLFWQYLLSTPNILETVKELQEEASSSREYDFYSQIAYFVDLELKMIEFRTHFDSDGNRID